MTIANISAKRFDAHLSFQALQYQFANYLRNPAQYSCPSNIEERRMAIYAELFYNNIENFISNGFPVLRSITPDQQWHAMVRDFFHRHPCQTPYFLKITEEFIHYLQHERDRSNDPAFLLELAHYEWVELALDIAEQEIPTTGINPNGDLLLGIPAVSPLAVALSYNFPVHRISSDCITQQPEAPTYIIVYRNRADAVKFMEINATTARLLQLFNEHPTLTGLGALKIIIAETKSANPEQLLAAGRQTLAHLHASDIILGIQLIGL